MSKIKKLNSRIKHWQNDEAIISLDTNFYIFRESQGTGTELYYDFTTWEWEDQNIKILEVGVHPEITDSHEQ
jgi:hypothetical protein